MSRKIKFRYYDKEFKQFVYSDDFAWPNPLEKLSQFFQKAQNYADHIQQFAGLYDKNGKEIYEGDIVRKYWKSKKINNVTKLLDHGFIHFEVIWNEQHCGFGITKANSHSYEIVGNIYQNKELVKK